MAHDPNQEPDDAMDDSEPDEAIEEDGSAQEEPYEFSEMTPDAKIAKLREQLRATEEAYFLASMMLEEIEAGLQGELPPERAQEWRDAAQTHRRRAEHEKGLIKRHMNITAPPTDKGIGGKVRPIRPARGKR